MDFDTPKSTWIPLPLWCLAVTLTFNLQNLIRSAVGDGEHSLPVTKLKWWTLWTPSYLQQQYTRYCNH